MLYNHLVIVRTRTKQNELDFFVTHFKRKIIIKSLFIPISGIAEFMGFPGMTTMVVPLDPSEPTKLGYHANKYVSIWVRNFSIC